MLRLILTAGFIAGAAPVLAGDTYYIDGYRQSCRVGQGGEGIIAVGNGWISLTESYYERQGKRQALPGGWQRAQWACMAEGMECGRERLDIRLDAGRVDVRNAAGRTFTGLRCPA